MLWNLVLIFPNLFSFFNHIRKALKWNSTDCLIVAAPKKCPATNTHSSIKCYSKCISQIQKEHRWVKREMYSIGEVSGVDLLERRVLNQLSRMMRNVQGGRGVGKWHYWQRTTLWHGTVFVAWNSVRRAFEGFEQSNLTRFAIDSHHLNNSLKDKLGSNYIIG